MATTVPPIRYASTELQQAHNELFDGSLKTIPQILPPNVSAQDFSAAIADLIKAIGADGVFVGDALSDYVDCFATDASTTSIPSAAVCPVDTSHLQSILATANKYQIPLWTFSRGKNLGFGGPTGCVAGSIAVDLHRMNKVIEVNEEHAYAVVEPGVTFLDLYQHCAKHDLKLWPSCPALSWGSVVGNSLERGLGFVPTANHSEEISGMEVMLADGSLLRTGQWANSTTSSAHLSKFAFGPGIEGLFLQSNLGIVTKMGVALTPAPQAFMPVTFSVSEEEVGTLVEVLGDLRKRGIVGPTYAVNIGEWSWYFSKAREEWWDGEGHIPNWRYKEIAKQLGTDYWTVRTNFYGPAAINQAQCDELVRTMSKAIPGSETRFITQSFKAEDGKVLAGADVPMEHGGIWAGVPTLWTTSLKNFLPSSAKVGAHSAYNAIIPLSGPVLHDWGLFSRQAYEAENLDPIFDFYVHEKQAVWTCLLIFDKLNPENCAAMERVWHVLFQEGKKRGFTCYRTHVNKMDTVAEENDFNNFAYRTFLEKIKDAVDPNGILSPGKQGIWPAKYRAMRHHKSNT